MDFITKHGRLIAISVACVVGLLLLLYTITYMDSCNFNKDLNANKAEVNALSNTATQVNANIENLDRQAFEKRTEINTQKAEKEKVHKEVENAQKNKNKAVGNLANVVNGNYSNTSTVNAYAALCEAYPIAPSCTR